MPLRLMCWRTGVALTPTFGSHACRPSLRRRLRRELRGTSKFRSAPLGEHLDAKLNDEENQSDTLIGRREARVILEFSMPVRWKLMNPTGFLEVASAERNDANPVDGKGPMIEIRK